MPYLGVRRHLLWLLLVAAACGTPDQAHMAEREPQFAPFSRSRQDLPNLPVLCELPARGLLAPLNTPAGLRIVVASTFGSFTYGWPCDPVVELIGPSREGWRSPAVLWRVWVAGAGPLPSLTNVGDEDADGVDDLLACGIWRSDLREKPVHQPCEIWSGADGHLLRVIDVPDAGSDVGASAARLGVDTDVPGHWLLLGCPGTRTYGSSSEVRGGSMYCVTDSSDVTTPVRWRVGPEDRSMDFGGELAVVRDVRQDARPAVLVGNRGFGRDERQGTVQLVSGATGATLESLIAPDGCDGFGSSLAMTGDVDGDGMRDVAVGAPGAQCYGPAGEPEDVVTGRVLLYSLAGGTRMLREIDGRKPGDGFGASIVAIEDHTGDGIPELMVLSSPFPPLWREGAIDVVDPSNGTRVQSFEFPSTAPCPERLFAIGDLDGDGLSEVGLHVMRTDVPDGYTCESMLILHGVK
jgi:hypothetical protein